VVAATVSPLDVAGAPKPQPDNSGRRKKPQ